VTIQGAGPGRTIISGGGPVLTIGGFGVASEPTVNIEGVTITGGATQDSPMSTAFTGTDGAYAAGGGVEIPPNADIATRTPLPGATVKIANSVITGNRVAPAAVADSGQSCPGLFPGLFPDGDCPFAAAFGGGIDSSGNLTVTNTTVSDNLVGTASGLSDLASNADGAGINSEFGSALTVANSVIRDNSATASAPDGQFAEGGGIYAGGSMFTMTNSTVTGDTARLDAAFPDTPVSSNFGTDGGGIHIEGSIASGSVTNSIVSDNSVTTTNDVGSAFADSGGIREDSPFPLSNDILSGNHVTAETLPGSSASSTALGDAGAGHIWGNISNSRLIDNTVSATAADGGSAVAAAGGSLTFGTFNNDIVSGNAISASSETGAPTVAGGGLLVGTLTGASEPLTLHNTLVSANTASTSGGQGQAVGFGGGIFDNPAPADGLAGGPLDLVNSRVVGNSLIGPDATLLGGGIFAPGEPLTFTNSQVTGNLPDQCFGC
jgi:hypothetical protein